MAITLVSRLISILRRERRVMEDKVINHFCHEHPLILTENVGNKDTMCFGCCKPIISELAYVCTDQYCTKISESTIHKRCAELPRKISHPSHPLHHLNLRHYTKLKHFYTWGCSLCGVSLEGGLGYRCSICNFAFDISCPKIDSIFDLLEKKRLQHKSHVHPLTLMRRPAPFSFDCDACGTDDSDMCYMCSTCEFMIHETCALLPDNTLQTQHHHHQLLLAFNFPIEYGDCIYNCDVCRKELQTTGWVYYCVRCRYFAHIKCAVQSQGIPAESSSNLNVDDLIQLPVDDFSKELITPFVNRTRENEGLEEIPAKDLPTSVTMPQTTASFSLLFNYHKHPLSLVSEGPTTDHRDESLIMKCDVCVSPVHSPPYYHCPTCNNYFVHSTCYLLPKTLSCSDALELYGECPTTHENHKFTLFTGSELDNQRRVRCSLCLRRTNGRVYGCGDCKLMMDVKCAALPATLKHASHPHILMMKRVEKQEGEFREKECGGCGCAIEYGNLAYHCADSGCGFVLDIDCVVLPKSIKHEWDKHPLMLTYDPTVDHPSDFYCENCEEEMDPKGRMYHCRECDRSFHDGCLHENMKYGRQVEFDRHLHPHPLTMTPVAIKLRCDACRTECYNWGGFQCELCNFALCYRCGVDELAEM